MDTLDRRAKCCGCTACISVCPQKAIIFEEDNEGFFYPKKNNDMCTSCRLCEQVCLYKTNVPPFLDRIGGLKPTYAVQHLDENIRMRSQSGGMFRILADRIIDIGGIVYGAVLSDTFHVAHKRAETRKKLDPMSGSKYVQSNLEGIFVSVLNDLKSNIPVLFSGTPCQVYGLRGFLQGRYRENLYLVDLICHGVPSPKIWNDYLTYMKKRGKKIEEVNFRDKKEFGWNSHIETITFSDKKIANTDYASLFYSDLVHRPSCYKCPFTNLNRPSDITIGDCWGVDSENPELHDNSGMSTVIINTKKGSDLFALCKKNMIYKKIILKGAYLQIPLQQPVDIDWKSRKHFWKDYNVHGFDYIVAKYASRKVYKTSMPRRLSLQTGKVTIVIWGTGNGFKDTIADVQKYGDIKYICDNNKALWGKTIALGKICIPPSKLVCINNVFVLIAVQNICTAFEISNQLLDMGITNFDSVYHWLGYADKLEYG